ncbi:MAG: hypothetical protein JWM64_240 [Frankiales bacterium]|nr:hypothetical protein [Frankiales bacterium]
MSAALELLHGLVLEDGARWGERATRWQRDDAAAIVDPAPDAPRLHFLTRPRGGSKTSDLAGLAVALLLSEAPAQSRSYAVASDAEQGGLLLDAVRGFIARTPGLQAALTVEARRVVVPSTGATLEALPADGASAYGLRPWLVIADELAQWASTPNARNVWTAVVSALPKVAAARLVCLTSAGDPSHWSHAVLTGAETAPAWRVSQVPGPVPWLSPVALEEQARLLTPSQYSRLHLNVWTASDDALVSAEDLRACVAHDGPLPSVPGVRYVVGVDLGLKNDRTVLAVCHSEGRRVVLDRLLRFAGTRAAPVSLADVEAAVLGLHERYNAPRFIADPWQAVGLMQRVRAKGVAVEEFTFSASSVGRLASVLFRLLRDREIALPDDADLLAELGAVRLRENGSGVLRLDHASGGHDDQAVALGLAAQALAQEGGPTSATIHVPGGRVPLGAAAITGGFATGPSVPLGPTARARVIPSIGGMR